MILPLLLAIAAAIVAYRLSRPGFVVLRDETTGRILRRHMIVAATLSTVLPIIFGGGGVRAIGVLGLSLAGFLGAAVGVLLSARDRPHVTERLLLRSLVAGDLEGVSNAIARGADPTKPFPSLSSTSFPWGGLPIDIAATLGHDRVVKLLLEHGVDATEDAAAWIANQGRTDLLARILDTNPGLGESGKAADAAASLGNVETLRMLLRRDPSIAARPALLSVAIERGQRSVIDLLLNHGGRIDGSHLLAAVASGDLGLLEFVCKQVKPAALREYESDALASAIRAGQWPIVEYLYSRSPTLDPVATGERSPLLQAIELTWSNDEEVRALAWRIIDYCLTRRAGVSDPAVMEAAVRRRTGRLVERLLNNGARVDGEHGGTLLWTAAAARDVDTARILIEHGLDVNATNHYGNSILGDILFRAFVDSDMERLLKSHGARNVRRDSVTG